MFRKGPRVSRRLCGFRRGRPFSGSVVNPSFFFFFSTHPTPPKTKATFFLLSAPLEPSIEVARSPVDPESTVKNIPSNEVYLQRSAAAAARGRTKGARTRRLQDHIDRAGARLVFFFFFWVAETLRRGRLEQREVCRFFTTGWRGRESEGDRRGVSRSGADGLEP